jgi:hypothetical protein
MRTDINSDEGGVLKHEEEENTGTRKLFNMLCEAWILIII